MKDKLKDFNLKSFLLMSAGTIILAFGVTVFKIPHGFMTGGVTGYAMFIHNFLPMLKTSTWVAILNIVLMILGFIFLGKSTGGKTVYCTLLFSGSNMLIEWLYGKIQIFRGFEATAPLTDQLLLELLYAMILSAIGSAMVFNENASTGGSEILALIIKKYTSIDTGKALFCSDFIVACSSFVLFGVEIGLLSLAGLFIKAFLIDSVIDTINCSKYFLVITEKPEIINEFILKTLGHGATTHEAKGEYTNSKKTMIHTVCKRIEAARLKKKIKEIDPGAFIIVTTTSEIIGRGFRAV